MSWWQWLAIGAAAFVVVYATLVGLLLAAGRREDARAVASFVPDCLVLFRRVLGDPRVPRRRKLLVAALVAYLALPFDLVPDFLPVIGQLDDAILVALVLRAVLRGGGADVLAEHWPGPQRSLDVLTRLAFGTTVPAADERFHVEKP